MSCSRSHLDWVGFVTAAAASKDAAGAYGHRGRGWGGRYPVGEVAEAGMIAA